ncbi:MAG: alpha/beta hydrolase [Planctomycetia bacterium]|nr:alpha/beta hydrolase [Planctomycetia bacterium]
MKKRTVPVQFLFISGLGADGQIFTNQLKAFPDSAAAEWPLVRSDWALEDYALAVASPYRILREKSDRPLVVCGLSFGGMLAPFIAETLNADACILLASCRHPCQLRWWYRPLALPFIRIPFLFWLIAFPCQLLLWIFLHLFAWTLGKRWRSLLHQFNHAGVKRLYHFIRMILDIRWTRNEVKEKSYSFPIFHVHGEIDRVIPLKNVHPNIIVPKGGHLFLCWKVEETNQILEDFCQSLESK